MTNLLGGKVVVVTGAGRGVGAEIAKLAAREGAQVIVNDIGADATGAGGDGGPAAHVVDAIRQAGGVAEADGNDVSSWQGAHAIVEAALRAFGRIDCIVNNAGILRDMLFHKMEEADWDAVVAVNLKGCFNVARAAAPHFRQQSSGAFVHMTSTSGLIGNFGQVNYAAAKLGIAALSKGIALDMARSNVRSNCIAPFAWTRMLATIPETPENAERLKGLRTLTADKIAPLAVALLSDRAAGVNGQIFGIRRNELFLFSQPRPVRSVHAADGWTPETCLGTALPALAGSFHALDRSSDVFTWDPI